MMPKHVPTQPTAIAAPAEKSGFTLIEVMLVLAITGMMLLGMLGGTFSTIARQRYTDSLRSFSEYLSRKYSEVISPESLGYGNSDEQAILGKVIVFGEDYGNASENRSVYSATLVGSAKPVHQASNLTFLQELAAPETQAALYCGEYRPDGTTAPSTVEVYEPLWESTIQQSADDGGNPDNQFKGTIIIARTPSSGTVHTVYSKQTYNLKNECTPDSHSASDNLKNDLQSGGASFEPQKIRMCLKNNDVTTIRQIDIARDGRNSSAIATLPEGESRCGS